MAHNRGGSAGAVFVAFLLGAVAGLTAARSAHNRLHLLASLFPSTIHDGPLDQVQRL